ncbi:MULTISPECIES: phage repressor protein [unclassified Pantoea]|uniref:phage repressor protein n=1 Tax=unclassified Pantoea TaxID=2630326 RepID=UPI0020602871|nr:MULTISPECIES: phage repressor protein [unclassified Pantoea]MDU5474038.1 phage repressor protein [Pantoea sp.]DAI70343.1 MAG TPA: DNA polymerase V subunit UmuD [Bacteriophage sp.]
MGFQSPAQDYIERRLRVSDLVVHNPASTLIVERDGGLMVIDRYARVTAGHKVALLHDGETLIARMGECCLITEDGQRIAGEELEDVIMLGKITYEILSVWQNNGPV